MKVNKLIKMFRYKDYAKLIDINDSFNFIMLTKAIQVLDLSKIIAVNIEYDDGMEITCRGLPKRLYEKW